LRLKREFEHLDKSPASAHNKALVKKFYDDCALQGLSKPSKYANGNKVCSAHGQSRFWRCSITASRNRKNHSGLLKLDMLFLMHQGLLAFVALTGPS
jgi:hypothetical protein